MAEHNDLGHWGEDLAAQYLEKKGWYIRSRDWHFGHRDIDIVAIDEESSTLLIVEVKTRASDIWGEPDESIDLEKKNNIIKATAAYLRAYHMRGIEVRYDTISITGTPLDPDHVNIVHKENAFCVLDSYEYYRQQRKRNFYKHHPGQW